MKKKIYLGFAIVLFAGSLISGTLSSGGSPGGRSNSPIDASNCAACHTGSSVISEEWISTNIPVSGYVPGDTYTITAAGNHSGAVKFGFEITAEDESNKVGTFAITNATETKLANSNSSVTHTSGGNTASGGAKTWSFDWTAPVTGTGDVTFYGAFNAADGNGGTSGDIIYTSTLAVNEDLSIGIKENTSNSISIAPNPAKNIITLNSVDLINNISLYNISGKQILNISNLHTNSRTIDLSEMSSGMYIIKISGENFNTSEKLLIK